MGASARHRAICGRRPKLMAGDCLGHACRLRKGRVQYSRTDYPRTGFFFLGGQRSLDRGRVRQPVQRQPAAHGYPVLRSSPELHPSGSSRHRSSRVSVTAVFAGGRHSPPGAGARRRRISTNRQCTLSAESRQRAPCTHAAGYASRDR